MLKTQGSTGDHFATLLRTAAGLMDAQRQASLLRLLAVVLHSAANLGLPSGLVLLVMGTYEWGATGVWPQAVMWGGFGVVTAAAVGFIAWLAVGQAHSKLRQRVQTED